MERLLRRCREDSALADFIPVLTEILQYELHNQVPHGEGLLARLQEGTFQKARRVAIISDIHGNQEGLSAVLDDVAAQACDRIICLGDLVEGGPCNEEVVETLRRMKVPCVRGNHDEINDVPLHSETRQYLARLPEQIVENDVLFVHISPRKKKRSIDQVEEAWNVFDETSYRLIFVGHTHVPQIYGKHSMTHGAALRHEFHYNRPFQLQNDDRYIISVGSVGYGRDSVAKIRYCIFDREADTLEMRAIEGPLLALDYSVARSR